MAQGFVHLRLHSEFSIVDGVARIQDAVAAAAADGQGALALTDSSSLFGAVRFYKAARAAGVKPILGCDAWITNHADRERPYRLLLLVRDRAGYLGLCRLLSRAWLENAHRGRAEFDPAWFEQGGGDGLIALSGGTDGEIAAHLAAGALEAAQAAARRLAGCFPGSFYIELQRAGRRGDDAACRSLINLAGTLGLPVVATHPVQFVARDAYRAHEARVCIAEGHTLADPRRPRRFSEEQYFKSRAEMAERFADVPVALDNAVQIARRCNLTLELNKPRLPDFPTPQGVGVDEHCRALSYAGLDRRLAVLYPQPAERDARRPTYTERLDLELGTIAKMGFSGYFLIVADFINWAKGHGVPVGPGRGSGAGSLVAYSLGITDLDPLRYDLLFERFLNPERVSMPDFDIDFCQDNRDRVIDYVKEKYGANAVAQIATFGTLGAKAVVRDVGRVLDLPYSKCDQLSKLIPHNPADPWTLDRALADEPAFADAVNNDEEAGQLIELARPLEGLTRNVGMHAGGVLIAPGKLTDFCPLYCAPGTDAVVSQYDKDDIEAIGLVKFDFLGLTTLTILELALQYVRQLDPSSTLALDAIPLDDQAVFKIFQGGNTTAIFQFESRGMRDLLKRARPDRLDDLIALNALYRPGPMDLIPDFCDRKHGRQRVEYLDPRLEPILGSTYGIMVYQEQVMRIAQAIGGYSLGGADLLRRAMGKKKPEEMAKHRGIFVEGAGKNGVAANVAAELFDLMEKFAGYGFNKSHSAAYALVAYQTAYLKVHHPAAFAAANLSAVMGDTDKVQEFVADAKANGLRVEAPDINHGQYRFVPVDAQAIRYGLGAIKGTGQGAIEAIAAERERGGPFGDLFDFCRRVDRRQVNRRVVEALVRAGCFDGLDANRARLFASVGRALEHAEREAAAEGQGSLFGAAGPAAMESIDYVSTAAWSERERLANEKVALGYYFSGHLFAEYEVEARRLAPLRLADLRQAREAVRLAGVIVGARMQNTRRGRMCALVLDDGSAQLEVAVFGELLDQRRAMLKEDALVFVVGRARFDEFAQRLSVTAEQIMDLAEARIRAQGALRIEVDGTGEAVPAIKSLQALLMAYRVVPAESDPEAAADGGCRVVVAYRNLAGSAKIALPDAWRVNPEDRLLDELRVQPRVAAVAIEYS
ncbi:MAG TPA: DNA polymerase III subunit alpha [Burkholderiaceae bacterium]|nr:DNA polymerase III subunit alpha [Burkholderiaceae bacterium]